MIKQNLHISHPKLLAPSGTMVNPALITSAGIAEAFQNDFRQS